MIKKTSLVVLCLIVFTAIGCGKEPAEDIQTVSPEDSAEPIVADDAPQADPNWGIEPEEVTPYELILQEYQHAIETDFIDYPSETFNPNDIVALGFRMIFNSKEGFYYCIEDVDNNGTQELLIATTFTNWGEESCVVHDIWTMTEGEPVRIMECGLGEIEVGSGNMLEWYGFGGGEFGHHLQIADDGKTALAFARIISKHYTDGSLYYFKFEEPLASWDDLLYNYHQSASIPSWDEGETPENLVSDEELNRIREGYGFAKNYYDRNMSFRDSWKPLFSDGPTFLTIKIGTTSAKGAELYVRDAPNTESEILGRLHDRWDVAIIEESNGWYAIKYRGNTGYVSSDYVLVD